MCFFTALTTRWESPDAVALVTDEAIISFTELAQRVHRAVGWLSSQGVGPGDVVALQLPRSLAMLELHLANLALGSITLPLNPAYTASEVSFLLSDSGARLAALLPGTAVAVDAGETVVHTPSGLRQALDAADALFPPSPSPEDTGVLCYTSGTTGKPKGALISHGNLLAITRALHEAWRWEHSDVLLHALPLFHIHGLFVAQHGALYAGAQTVWMSRFDAARTLQAIDEHGATVFMGVPTFYHRLLQLPETVRPSLATMRLFTSGSAPLPAEVHRAFEARFGHVVLERYGMTEIGIALSNPYDSERRPGAVGFPLPTVEARIADPDTDVELPAGQVGEVQVRGPTVFSGYLGRPEATLEALRGGWMHSGDLGRVDADGYFHIIGRAKDMVLSGGLNVYPREVEVVLCSLPGVAEAAVVGVADPDLGERVVASMVAKPGVRLDLEAISRHCRTTLADFKRPKALEQLDALPRNTMGKVQKNVLRQRWSAARVRAIADADVDFYADNLLALALESEDIQLEPDAARRGTRGLLEHSDGACGFVATWAGRPVGQCALTREWSDWRGVSVLWLQSLFVLPAYRRRGVARALVMAALDSARAQHAELRLYVEEENESAHALYRGLGLAPTGYRVWADES